MMNITDTLVLIKGAGDLASGVAARLFRCGFPVIMTELPHPLMVRRTVAFGEAVYEGRIVGENSRPEDIPVNVCRTKKLTNMRASGKDDNVILTPIKPMTLEQAMAYGMSEE